MFWKLFVRQNLPEFLIIITSKQSRVVCATLGYLWRVSDKAPPFKAESLCIHLIITQKVCNMKRTHYHAKRQGCRSAHNRNTIANRHNRKGEVSTLQFQIGELYIFHPSNIHCPAKSSLWGIYDKRTRNTIHLESSSRNLHTFDIWHALPHYYHYARLATRSELRDYEYNLCWYEAHICTLSNKAQKVHTLQRKYAL